MFPPAGGFDVHVAVAHMPFGTNAGGGNRRGVMDAQ